MLAAAALALASATETLECDTGIKATAEDVLEAAAALRRKGFEIYDARVAEGREYEEQIASRGWGVW